MENKKPTQKIESKNEVTNVESTSGPKVESTIIPNKPVKPPKVEDKPFEEFIIKHFIPGLKISIEQTGISVLNIKLIGITSKKDSILYKNADVNFLLPNVKEAGPGGFVPTSSTIMSVIPPLPIEPITLIDWEAVPPCGEL